MGLGKIQIIPTVNKDDTAYAASGQATDAQLIRWVRGWRGEGGVRLARMRWTEFRGTRTLGRRPRAIPSP